MLTLNRIEPNFIKIDCGVNQSNNPKLKNTKRMNQSNDPKLKNNRRSIERGRDIPTDVGKDEEVVSVGTTTLDGDDEGVGERRREWCYICLPLQMSEVGKKSELMRTKKEKGKNGNSLSVSTNDFFLDDWVRPPSKMQHIRVSNAMS